MLLRALRIPSSIAGKIPSPLNNSSTRLPPIIGASVCAEMVGKNDGSPRTTLGILLISGTLAQPKARRRTPINHFFVFMKTHPDRKPVLSKDDDHPVSLPSSCGD